MKERTTEIQKENTNERHN